MTPNDLQQARGNREYQLREGHEYWNSKLAVKLTDKQILARWKAIFKAVDDFASHPGKDLIELYGESFLAKEFHLAPHAMISGWRNFPAPVSFDAEPTWLGHEVSVWLMNNEPKWRCSLDDDSCNFLHNLRVVESNTNQIKEHINTKHHAEIFEMKLRIPHDPQCTKTKCVSHCARLIAKAHILKQRSFDAARELGLDMRPHCGGVHGRWDHSTEMADN